MSDHLSRSETCESIDGEEMEVLRRGLNIEINAWDREDDEMLWTVALDPYNAKRLAMLLDARASA